jgi:hypothetical protein
MTEITVRVLDKRDWPLYRDVDYRPGRVPHILLGTLADEADQDEQLWRDRMDRFPTAPRRTR